mmetsp:Transcript_25379/g.51215  ORF Transcript_25379/g.51215 Transcript_25379/m.51215 type:complete len:305 (-) Transcript_25379:25-939(-)
MRLPFFRIATALATASHFPTLTLSFESTPLAAFVSSSPSLPSLSSRPSSSFLILSLLHGSGGTTNRNKVAFARSETTMSNASNPTPGECNATNPPHSYDPEYPGTAVQRLRSVHERVSIIATDNSLNGPWEEVRRRILWAGGLRDLPDAVPGQGYTGHSFNDFNHVDLTTMNDDSSDNLNDGSVKGIAIGNRLGPGIRIASLPELGPGGSWSTCALGCNSDPPQDVAHVQFRSRIAFKLVWVPNENYDTFVLVDDDGKLLATGKPSDGPGALPSRREREMNFRIVQGSKYAVVAENMAKNSKKP